MCVAVAAMAARMGAYLNPEDWPPVSCRQSEPASAIGSGSFPGHEHIPWRPWSSTPNIWVWKMLKTGVTVSHQALKRHSKSSMNDLIRRNTAFLCLWQEELTAELAKPVELVCAVLQCSPLGVRRRVCQRKWLLSYKINAEPLFAV